MHSNAEPNQAPFTLHPHDRVRLKDDPSGLHEIADAMADFGICKLSGFDGKTFETGDLVHDWLDQDRPRRKSTEPIGETEYLRYYRLSRIELRGAAEGIYYPEDDETWQSILRKVGRALGPYVDDFFEYDEIADALREACQDLCKFGSEQDWCDGGDEQFHAILKEAIALGQRDGLPALSPQLTSSEQEDEYVEVAKVLLRFAVERIKAEP